MKKAIALTTLALAAMSTAPCSQAAPVTVNFSAVVTRAGNGLPAVLGSTIQGTVTYGDVPSSSELLPASQCGPLIACARYTFDTAPSQFSVDFGGTSIASAMVTLNMYIDDVYVAGGPEVEMLPLVLLSSKVNGVSYTLSLYGTADPSFSVTNLSDASAVLSQWRPGGDYPSYFHVFDPWGQSASGFQAQITGLSVSSVPEPASVALFALGLGGVALASRRRARPRVKP